MSTKDNSVLIDEFEKAMNGNSESDVLNDVVLEEDKEMETENEKTHSNTNVNRYEILKREFPNFKKVSGMHTKEVKRESLIIAGIYGDLVWDYFLFNEITFDVENEKYSLFTSVSDIKTSDVWHSIISKYK